LTKIGIALESPPCNYIVQKLEGLLWEVDNLDIWFVGIRHGYLEEINQGIK
jgi:hypothetical protein